MHITQMIFHVLMISSIFISHTLPMIAPYMIDAHQMTNYLIPSHLVQHDTTHAHITMCTITSTLWYLTPCTHVRTHVPIHVSLALYVPCQMWAHSMRTCKEKPQLFWVNTSNFHTFYSYAFIGCIHFTLAISTKDGPSFSKSKKPSSLPSPTT